MLKPQIQKSADVLANLCIENTETHNNYTDEDLLNATMIFSHFLFDAICTAKKDVSSEERCKIVYEAGNAIREIIKSSTGKDTVELTKKVYGEPSKKAPRRKI
jgi:hypothetical protein